MLVRILVILLPQIGSWVVLGHYIITLSLESLIKRFMRILDMILVLIILRLTTCLSIGYKMLTIEGLLMREDVLGRERGMLVMFISLMLKSGHFVSIYMLRIALVVYISLGLIQLYVAIFIISIGSAHGIISMMILLMR